MAVLTLIGSAAAIIVVFVWWCRKQLIQNTDFMRRLPVPDSTLPLFGNALDLTSNKVVLKNFQKWTESYGDIVKIQIGPFRKILVITNYQLLEHVLSSTKLITKSIDYNFFQTWLGTGLLTGDGQKWKSHRKILTPGFHFKILEQFIEIFQSCSDTLIEKFQGHVNDDSVDVYPYVTLCTLDIICESIMSIKINAQGSDNGEYVKSVKDMCRILMDRARSPVEMYDFLFPLTRNFYTERKALKVLHKTSNDVILARKKELEKEGQQKKEKTEEELYFKNKKVFLDLLLQSTVNGSKLTQEEIRQEVDTFMFAGHDTTASAVSFALYCLANHPDVQRKVYEEQQNIFKGKTDATVTGADLQEMNYLELVIKETLRLYPPVPFVGRRTTEDVKYGDETIPKGVTFILFTYGTHRSHQYFDNPQEFLPERFESADGKRPYAYTPFSAGPRNCIGQKFAMLEMKSVLSKMLRNFELAPATPRHELDLVPETILKSINGIRIKLRPRK